MEFFRKNMKIIFFITISGFIISIFAGIGGYYFKKKQDLVAIVNSTKIYKEEFETYFNRILSNKSIEKKAPLTESEKEEAKNITVSTLLQKNIFLQQAKKTGLNINDKEIMNVIKNQPMFQENKVFNHQKYFIILRNQFNQTPQEFEASIKQDLLIRKMRFLILNLVKTTDTELENEYIRINKSMRKYKKEKDGFKQNMLKQKQFSILNNWLQHTANNSKIKVFLKK